MRIQLVTRKTELIIAAFFKAIIQIYYPIQDKEVWKFLGFFISFLSRMDALQSKNIFCVSLIFDLPFAQFCSKELKVRTIQ
ncbi:MAG: hypothetical protein CMO01_07905 [Thalassobius sp.]|nr:hypothetical protein [Thalassovita sp.]